MAISFSITTCYLIFYPRDFTTKVHLQALHYVGIFLMTYIITFVIATIEPVLNGDLKYWVLVSLLIFFTASITLIFLFKSSLRIIAICITAGFVGLILFIDFVACEDRSKEVFYYNMLIESLFLGLGVALYLGRIPECCCR